MLHINLIIGIIATIKIQMSEYENTILENSFVVVTFKTLFLRFKNGNEEMPINII